MITVGELRRLFETYPDDLAIFIQADTSIYPNAVPEEFVVEYYEDSELLLLAGITAESYNLVPVNDPSASWNLPK